MSYNNEPSYNNEMSYNNETSENEDNRELDDLDLSVPPPLRRMNCAFVNYPVHEESRQSVFYFTQESEPVDITVLNRQTNGPHPDCDLEFDAASTPTEEDENQELVVPTHPLELEFFNFADTRYSRFYNNMYNFIQPGIISYTEYEDEENKIQEIDLDELVMPTPCPTCYRFDCNC
jgi:hypothetical protein